MTLFDIAVMAVSIAIGTWGAFGLVNLLGKMLEIGGPFVAFNLMCIGLWLWWTVFFPKARRYKAKHQFRFTDPSFMRAWHLL